MKKLPKNFTSLPTNNYLIMENFDLKSLQSRINEIKQDGQESVDFTIEYINCLIERHDLSSSLPEDYELDNVPECVFESIRKGNVPTKEEIILMDSEVQNYLLFELIWLCGMTAISFYSSCEEIEEGIPGTFDVIIDMVNVSPGHWSACYLIAVLTLLMAKIPSESVISVLTDNFSDDPNQIQINMNYFIEFAASVLQRHKEDCVYHLLNSKDDN